MSYFRHSTMNHMTDAISFNIDCPVLTMTIAGTCEV